MSEISQAQIEMETDEIKSQEINFNGIVPSSSSPESETENDESKSGEMKKILTQLAFTPTFANMRIRNYESPECENLGGLNSSADTLLLDLSSADTVILDPSSQTVEAVIDLPPQVEINDGDTQLLTDIDGGTQLLTDIDDGGTQLLNNVGSPQLLKDIVDGGTPLLTEEKNSPNDDDEEDEVPHLEVRDKNSNPEGRKGSLSSRANFWLTQLTTASRKKITMKDISASSSSDPLSTSKKMRSPKETMKEFQEGMNLASEIMKKGLRHTGRENKPTLWIKVERLSADDVEEEEIEPDTAKRSARRKRSRSQSEEELQPAPSLCPGVNKSEGRKRGRPRKKPLNSPVKSSPAPVQSNNSPAPALASNSSSPSPVSRAAEGRKRGRPRKKPRSSNEDRSPAPVLDSNPPEDSSPAPDTIKRRWRWSSFQSCPICFNKVRASILEKHAADCQGEYLTRTCGRNKRVKMSDSDRNRSLRDESPEF